jgi:predicted TIM-barrel fold metal-dependent hydrolase
MIIDANTHGLHGKDLDRLESAGGDWAKKSLAGIHAVTQNKPHFFDVGLRLEMLDRAGIDLQVITPGHQIDCNAMPGTGAEQLRLAKAINENMARLMEDSKGRLVGIGNLPLADFENGAAKEMERAIGVLGLKGINIPTNLRGKAIDLSDFEPFWAGAAGRKVPIYIHPLDPFDPSGRPYEAEYGLTYNFGWPFETALVLSRLVFSGLMDKYPDLKIVSHHLGGGIPFAWGRMSETYVPERQKKFLGRVLPRPVFDYFSSFYYDTVVGEHAPAIRCAYDVFGADRIVFATDAPYGPGSGESRLTSYPAVIRSLGFPETDNQKIFEGNIRSILNLK